MDTVFRPRVVLDLGSYNYPHLLVRGEAIYTGISGHPALFVNPSPAMPVLAQAVQDLDQAQQATILHTPGAVQARNLAGRALVGLLRTAQGYVQGLIDADPQQAGVITNAASMFLAKAPAYTKPFLKASQGMPGAPVHIVANVGVLTAGVTGRITFNWQLSSDGGKTWIEAPASPHGKTDIPGLSPLTTYAFRVGVTNGKGPGPWSQAVTFLVH